MKNRREIGFTTIELVLTIALLGVLALGITTMTMNYKRSYMEVAPQKARADIEYARGLAMMKRGTTFGVFFDDTLDRYTVYEASVSSAVASPQTKQSLIENFSKWPGVTVTGGNYTVEFGQFGQPTTGGGGSVQLTNGTVTKTISVTANTGRVTVQ